MRKTYGPEYPRTLGALMAWSGMDSAGPAVTDAAGTLKRRALQNRVLRVAAGPRTAGVCPAAYRCCRSTVPRPNAGPDQATGAAPCRIVPTLALTQLQSSQMLFKP